MNKCKMIALAAVFSMAATTNSWSQRAAKPAKWVGTYLHEGERLDLYSDNSYVLNSGSFSNSGPIIWDGTTANLSGTGQKFKLIGSSLMNASTKAVFTKDGAAPDLLAATTAMDNQLLGRKWVLIELMGQKIDIKDEKKQAYLSFNEAENRYSGYTGCNTFGGEVLNASDKKIALGQAIQTMKACFGVMDIENGLNRVLKNADSYSVNNGVLSLSKAKMAVMARFKFVKY